MHAYLCLDQSIIQFINQITSVDNHTHHPSPPKFNRIMVIISGFYESITARDTALYLHTLWLSLLITLAVALTKVKKNERIYVYIHIHTKSQKDKHTP